MGSLSPQYLAEVARRREAAAAKAAAACSTDGMWSARASASAAPFVLDTRDAAELTAAEVRSEFLAKFQPRSASQLEVGRSRPSLAKTSSTKTGPANRPINS